MLLTLLKNSETWEIEKVFVKPLLLHVIVITVAVSATLMTTNLAQLKAGMATSILSSPLSLSFSCSRDKWLLQSYEKPFCHVFQKWELFHCVPLFDLTTSQVYAKKRLHLVTLLVFSIDHWLCSLHLPSYPCCHRFSGIYYDYSRMCFIWSMQVSGMHCSCQVDKWNIRVTVLFMSKLLCDVNSVSD